MTFNLPTIKQNALRILKAIKGLLLIVLDWGFMALLWVFSSPIWFPIVIWKTGLIASDHIMKHITDD